MNRNDRNGGTPSQASMSDPLSLNLQRLILLLLAGLIAMSTYFVWCASKLAMRVDQSIVTFTGDMKDITAASAQISRDVSEMRARLQSIQDRFQEAVAFEALDEAFEELRVAGRTIRADTGTLDQDSEAEIKRLLRELMSSGLKFEERGKSRPISYLYARLYAKYKTFKGALSTTEEFIEEVATHTILGTPYQLIDGEGKRTSLKEWMQERLKEIRAGSPEESP